jgi:hypothetical protein
VDNNGVQSLSERKVSVARASRMLCRVSGTAKDGFWTLLHADDAVPIE